jgi:peptidase E
MTKYILNSGGLRNHPEKAKVFFAEVVKGLGPKPKVLVCFFAVERQDWEQKFAEYSKNYLQISPKGIVPELELAIPESFAEQVEKSDAVIIQGGDDHLLQYWLKKFDLPKLWEGKTVAGSSAGSDALCACFWPYDWRKSIDGLGILPIKFIPAYQSDNGNDDPRGPIDWQKGYDELKKYGDTSLPIHALPEGEFVVINL